MPITHMFGAHKAAKRFSLLLLEEGEDYVEDWVCEARWPANVSGNWQGLPKLQGRLRLCSKSLFFEPDDARIPIVRRVPFMLWATHPCALHHPCKPVLPVLHASPHCPLVMAPPLHWPACAVPHVVHGYSVAGVAPVAIVS